MLLMGDLNIHGHHLLDKGGQYNVENAQKATELYNKLISGTGLVDLDRHRHPRVRVVSCPPDSRQGVEGGSHIDRMLGTN